MAVSGPINPKVDPNIVVPDLDDLDDLQVQLEGDPIDTAEAGFFQDHGTVVENPGDGMFTKGVNRFATSAEQVIGTKSPEEVASVLDQINGRDFEQSWLDVPNEFKKLLTPKPSGFLPRGIRLPARTMVRVYDAYQDIPETERLSIEDISKELKNLGGIIFYIQQKGGTVEDYETIFFTALFELFVNANTNYSTQAYKQLNGFALRYVVRDLFAKRDDTLARFQEVHKAIAYNENEINTKTKELQKLIEGHGAWYVPWSPDTGDAVMALESDLQVLYERRYGYSQAAAEFGTELDDIQRKINSHQFEIMRASNVSQENREDFLVAMGDNMDLVPPHLKGAVQRARAKRAKEAPEGSVEKTILEGRYNEALSIAVRNFNTKSIPMNLADKVFMTDLMGAWESHTVMTSRGMLEASGPAIPTNAPDLVKNPPEGWNPLRVGPVENIHGWVFVQQQSDGEYLIRNLGMKGDVLREIRTTNGGELVGDRNMDQEYADLERAVSNNPHINNLQNMSNELMQQLGPMQAFFRSAVTSHASEEAVAMIKDRAVDLKAYWFGDGTSANPGAKTAFTEELKQAKQSLNAMRELRSYGWDKNELDAKIAQLAKYVDGMINMMAQGRIEKLIQDIEDPKFGPDTIGRWASTEGLIVFTAVVGAVLLMLAAPPLAGAIGVTLATAEGGMTVAGAFVLSAVGATGGLIGQEVGMAASGAWFDTGLESNFQRWQKDEITFGELVDTYGDQWATSFVTQALFMYGGSKIAARMVPKLLQSTNPAEKALGEFLKRFGAPIDKLFETAGVETRVGKVFQEIISEYLQELMENAAEDINPVLGKFVILLNCVSVTNAAYPTITDANIDPETGSGEAFYAYTASEEAGLIESLEQEKEQAENRSEKEKKKYGEATYDIDPGVGGIVRVTITTVKDGDTVVVERVYNPSNVPIALREAVGKQGRGNLEQLGLSYDPALQAFQAVGDTTAAELRESLNRRGFLVKEDVVDGQSVFTVTMLRFDPAVAEEADTDSDAAPKPTQYHITETSVEFQILFDEVVEEADTDVDADGDVDADVIAEPDVDLTGRLDAESGEDRLDEDEGESDPAAAMASNPAEQDTSVGDGGEVQATSEVDGDADVQAAAQTDADAVVFRNRLRFYQALRDMGVSEDAILLELRGYDDSVFCAPEFFSKIRQPALDVSGWERANTQDLSSAREATADVDLDLSVDAPRRTQFTLITQEGVQGFMDAWTSHFSQLSFDEAMQEGFFIDANGQIHWDSAPSEGTVIEVRVGPDGQYLVRTLQDGDVVEERRVPQNESITINGHVVFLPVYMPAYFGMHLDPVDAPHVGRLDYTEQAYDEFKLASQMQELGEQIPTGAHAVTIDVVVEDVTKIDQKSFERAVEKGLCDTEVGWVVVMIHDQNTGQIAPRVVSVHGGSPKPNIRPELFKTTVVRGQAVARRHLRGGYAALEAEVLTWPADVQERFWMELDSLVQEETRPKFRFAMRRGKPFSFASHQDAATIITNFANSISSYFAPLEPMGTFRCVNGTPKMAHDYHAANPRLDDYSADNQQETEFINADGVAQTYIVPEHVMRKIDGWIRLTSHGLNTEVGGRLVLESMDDGTVMIVDFIPQSRMSESVFYTNLTSTADAQMASKDLPRGRIAEVLGYAEEIVEPISTKGLTTIPLHTHYYGDQMQSAYQDTPSPPDFLGVTGIEAVRTPKGGLIIYLKSTKENPNHGKSQMAYAHDMTTAQVYSESAIEEGVDTNPSAVVTFSEKDPMPPGTEHTGPTLRDEGKAGGLTYDVAAVHVMAESPASVFALLERSSGGFTRFLVSIDSSTGMLVIEPVSSDSPTYSGQNIFVKKEGDGLYSAHVWDAASGAWAQADLSQQALIDLGTLHEGLDIQFLEMTEAALVATSQSTDTSADAVVFRNKMRYYQAMRALGHSETAVLADISGLDDSLFCMPEYFGQMRQPALDVTGWERANALDLSSARNTTTDAEFDVAVDPHRRTSIKTNNQEALQDFMNFWASRLTELSFDRAMEEGFFIDAEGQVHWDNPPSEGIVIGVHLNPDGQYLVQTLQDGEVVEERRVPQNEPITINGHEIFLPVFLPAYFTLRADPVEAPQVGSLDFSEQGYDEFKLAAQLQELGGSISAGTHAVTIEVSLEDVSQVDQDSFAKAVTEGLRGTDVGWAVIVIRDGKTGQTASRIVSVHGGAPKPYIEAEAFTTSVEQGQSVARRHLGGDYAALEEQVSTWPSDVQEQFWVQLASFVHEKAQPRFLPAMLRGRPFSFASQEDAATSITNFANGISSFYALIEPMGAFRRNNGTPQQAQDYHAANPRLADYSSEPHQEAAFINAEGVAQTYIVPTHVMKKIDGWIRLTSHGLNTEIGGRLVIEPTADGSMIVVDFIPQARMSQSRHYNPKHHEDPDAMLDSKPLLGGRYAEVLGYSDELTGSISLDGLTTIAMHSHFYGDAMQSNYQQTPSKPDFNGRTAIEAVRTPKGGLILYIRTNKNSEHHGKSQMVFAHDMTTGQAYGETAVEASLDPGLRTVSPASTLGPDAQALLARVRSGDLSTYDLSRELVPFTDDERTEIILELIADPDVDNETLFEDIADGLIQSIESIENGTRIAMALVAELGNPMTDTWAAMAITRAMRADHLTDTEKNWEYTEDGPAQDTIEIDAIDLGEGCLQVAMALLERLGEAELTPESRSEIWAALVPVANETHDPILLRTLSEQVDVLVGDYVAAVVSDGSPASWQALQNLSAIASDETRQEIISPVQTRMTSGEVNLEAGLSFLFVSFMQFKNPVTRYADRMSVVSVMAGFVSHPDPRIRGMAQFQIKNCITKLDGTHRAQAFAEVQKHLDLSGTDFNEQMGFAQSLFKHIPFTAHRQYFREQGTSLDTNANRLYLYLYQGGKADQTAYVAFEPLAATDYAVTEELLAEPLETYRAAEQYIRNHPEMRPMDVVRINGQEFQVSRLLQDDEGKGYLHVVALVPVEVGGQMVYQPRLFYTSQSGGDWRSAPFMEYDASTGRTKYSKGLGRHYTAETQPAAEMRDYLEGLDETEAGTLRVADYAQLVAEDDARLPTVYRKGLKEGFRAESEVRKGEGLEAVQELRPGRVFREAKYDRYGRRIPPGPIPTMSDLEAITYPPGFVPDFTQPPVRTYTFQHSLLGECTVRVYQGEFEGESVNWAMAQDGQGRTWVRHIRFANAEVNSYGTMSPVLDTGILTSKPLEYREQIGNLPEENRVKFNDKYDDITPMLGHLEPIRAFKEAMEAQEEIPPAQSVSRLLDDSQPVAPLQQDIVSVAQVQGELNPKQMIKTEISAAELAAIQNSESQPAYISVNGVLYEIIKNTGFNPDESYYTAVHVDAQGRRQPVLITVRNQEDVITLSVSQEADVAAELEALYAFMSEHPGLAECQAYVSRVFGTSNIAEMPSLAQALAVVRELRLLGFPFEACVKQRTEGGETKVFVQIGHQAMVMEMFDKEIVHTLYRPSGFLTGEADSTFSALDVSMLRYFLQRQAEADRARMEADPNMDEFDVEDYFFDVTYRVEILSSKGSSVFEYKPDNVGLDPGDAKYTLYVDPDFAPAGRSLMELSDGTDVEIKAMSDLGRHAEVEPLARELSIDEALGVPGYGYDRSGFITSDLSEMRGLTDPEHIRHARAFAELKSFGIHASFDRDTGKTYVDHRFSRTATYRGQSHTETYAYRGDLVDFGRATIDGRLVRWYVMIDSSTGRTQFMAIDETGSLLEQSNLVASNCYLREHIRQLSDPDVQTQMAAIFQNFEEYNEIPLSDVVSDATLQAGLDLCSQISRIFPHEVAFFYRLEGGQFVPYLCLGDHNEVYAGDRGETTFMVFHNHPNRSYSDPQLEMALYRPSSADILGQVQRLERIKQMIAEGQIPADAQIPGYDRETGTLSTLIGSSRGAMQITIREENGVLKYELFYTCTDSSIPPFPGTIKDYFIDQASDVGVDIRGDQILVWTIYDPAEFSERTGLDMNFEPVTDPDVFAVQPQIDMADVMMEGAMNMLGAAEQSLGVDRWVAAMTNPYQVQSHGTRRNRNRAESQPAAPIGAEVSEDIGPSRKAFDGGRSENAAVVQLQGESDDMQVISSRISSDQLAEIENYNNQPAYIEVNGVRYQIINTLRHNPRIARYLGVGVDAQGRQQTIMLSVHKRGSLVQLSVSQQSNVSEEMDALQAYLDSTPALADCRAFVADNFGTSNVATVSTVQEGLDLVNGLRNRGFPFEASVKQSIQDGRATIFVQIGHKTLLTELTANETVLVLYRPKGLLDGEADGTLTGHDVNLLKNMFARRAEVNRAQMRADASLTEADVEEYFSNVVYRVTFLSAEGSSVFEYKPVDVSLDPSLSQSTLYIDPEMAPSARSLQSATDLTGVKVKRMSEAGLESRLAENRSSGIDERVGVPGYGYDQVQFSEEQVDASHVRGLTDPDEVRQAEAYADLSSFGIHAEFDPETGRTSVDHSFRRTVNYGESRETTTYDYQGELVDFGRTTINGRDVRWYVMTDPETGVSQFMALNEAGSLLEHSKLIATRCYLKEHIRQLSDPNVRTQMEAIFNNFEEFHEIPLSDVVQEATLEAGLDLCSEISRVFPHEVAFFYRMVEGELVPYLALGERKQVGHGDSGEITFLVFHNHPRVDSPGDYADAFVYVPSGNDILNHVNRLEYIQGMIREGTLSPDVHIPGYDPVTGSLTTLIGSTYGAMQISVRNDNGIMKYTLTYTSVARGTPSVDSIELIFTSAASPIGLDISEEQITIECLTQQEFSERTGLDMSFEPVRDEDAFAVQPRINMADVMVDGAMSMLGVGHTNLGFDDWVSQAINPYYVQTQTTRRNRGPEPQTDPVVGEAVEENRPSRMADLSTVSTSNQNQTMPAELRQRLRDLPVGEGLVIGRHNAYGMDLSNSLIGRAHLEIVHLEEGYAIYDDSQLLTTVVDPETGELAYLMTQRSQLLGSQESLGRRGTVFVDEGVLLGPGQVVHFGLPQQGLGSFVFDLSEEVQNQGDRVATGTTTEAIEVLPMQIPRDVMAQLVDLEPGNEGSTFDYEGLRFSRASNGDYQVQSLYAEGFVTIYNTEGTRLFGFEPGFGVTSYLGSTPMMMPTREVLLIEERHIELPDGRRILFERPAVAKGDDVRIEGVDGIWKVSDMMDGKVFLFRGKMFKKVNEEDVVRLSEEEKAAIAEAKRKDEQAAQAALGTPAEPAAPRPQVRSPVQFFDRNELAGMVAEANRSAAVQTQAIQVDQVARVAAEKGKLQTHEGINVGDRVYVKRPTSSHPEPNWQVVAITAEGRFIVRNLVQVTEGGRVEYRHPDSTQGEGTELIEGLVFGKDIFAVDLVEGAEGGGRTQQLEVQSPEMAFARRRHKVMTAEDGSMLVVSRIKQMFSSALAQANVGNCYLIAAFHSLLQSSNFDAIIRHSVREMEDGSYMVRIPMGSNSDNWVHVTNDDIRSKWNTQFMQLERGGKFFFERDLRLRLDPVSGAKGWKILEAAYMKHMTGGNDRAEIEGGLGHKALQTLLGDNMASVYFGDGWSSFAESSEFMRSRAENYLNRFHTGVDIATVGTKSNPDQSLWGRFKKFINPTFKVGKFTLYYRHAYSIESVDRNARTVVIVNPHNPSVKINMTYDQFMDCFTDLSAARLQLDGLLG